MQITSGLVIKKVKNTSHEQREESRFPHGFLNKTLLAIDDPRQQQDDQRPDQYAKISFEIEVSYTFFGDAGQARHHFDDETHRSGYQPPWTVFHRRTKPAAQYFAQGFQWWSIHGQR